MLVDDLYERYVDGSLDNYLNSVTDMTLLNNYIVEFEQLIKERNEMLFSQPNNQKIINTINNMENVRRSVFNRITNFNMSKSGGMS
jgi:transposase-like protein